MDTFCFFPFRNQQLHLHSDGKAHHSHQSGNSHARRDSTSTTREDCWASGLSRSSKASASHHSVEASAVDWAWGTTCGSSGGDRAVG